MPTDTSDQPTSDPLADSPLDATSSPAAKPIISVRDVHKSFGPVEVLRGITFDVMPGETLCILGGSGGGKSTLLKVMIGVHPPTSGDVVVVGRHVAGANENEMNRIRREFGVLFQSGALLNSMTVGQNVALPLEAHTKNTTTENDIIVTIKLEQVGLRGARDRLPSEISGGMQKRVGLARAIALDPKIVFYDEPSAGLDPIATSNIDQLINDLKDGYGMTNVVVTHVMESVQRIADKIIMLDKGQVLLAGTLDDLMSSDDPKVRRFVRGEVDILEPGGAEYLEYLDDLMIS